MSTIIIIRVVEICTSYHVNQGTF